MDAILGEVTIHQRNEEMTHGNGLSDIYLPQLKGAEGIQISTRIKSP